MKWYYTECIERKASGLLLADKRFAHQYSKAIKRRFMVPKILGEHKQLLNTIKPSTKQPTPFGYSTDKMTINRITYGPMVLFVFVEGIKFCFLNDVIIYDYSDAASKG
eukprot:709277_1